MPTRKRPTTKNATSISLEVGAPRDPTNLWPEPYVLTAPDGMAVGDRIKDKFENYLHRLVCAGTLPLAQAQYQESHDWPGYWPAAGSPTG